MKYLIILVALIAMPVFAGSAEEQLHNTGLLKLEALQEELAGGKLDDISYARKFVAITSEYMPDDYVLNSFSRDLLSLTKARDGGQIDQLKYEMTVSKRLSETQEALAKRTAQYEAQKRYVARAKEEEARRQAYVDNPPMNPFQALLMMNMINRSADRIGHAWDRPQVPVHAPINCHSYAFGNGIDTTCY